MVPKVRGVGLTWGCGIIAVKAGQINLIFILPRWENELICNFIFIYNFFLNLISVEISFFRNYGLLNKVQLGVGDIIYNVGCYNVIYNVCCRKDLGTTAINDGSVLLPSFDWTTPNGLGNNTD